MVVELSSDLLFFFDFPSDPKLFDLITQFLIGSELMIAPAVFPGLKEVGVYFPSGDRWYDFHTGKMMVESDSAPINITVPAPFNATTPVFIKGGSIIHTQNVEKIRRTDDLDNIFKLVVALTPVTDDASVAFGQMMSIKNYMNDASIDKCIGSNDCIINIAVNAVINNEGEAEVTITFDPSTHYSTLEEIFIESIKFYGVRDQICDEILNYCDAEDYIMECKNEKLLKVEYGTISYLVTKQGCNTIDY